MSIPMAIPMRFRLLLVALASAASGCARQERLPPPPFDPAIPVDSAPTPEPARAAPLRVENRHRADIVVYVVRGAVRTRLGTVPAATGQQLTIPPSFVNDAGGFYLVGDPVGGRAAVRSEIVVLRRGQRVVWTIESSLARSSIGIY